MLNKLKWKSCQYYRSKSHIIIICKIYNHHVDHTLIDYSLYLFTSWHLFILHKVTLHYKLLKLSFFQRTNWQLTSLTSNVKLWGYFLKALNIKINVTIIVCTCTFFATLLNVWSLLFLSCMSHAHGKLYEFPWLRKKKMHFWNQSTGVKLSNMLDQSLKQRKTLSSIR